jgi:hypothetical protein
MSREEIIIQLLRDYEYQIGDSDYCRISEIRASISYLENIVGEKRKTSMYVYIGD